MSAAEQSDGGGLRAVPAGGLLPDLDAPRPQRQAERSSKVVRSRERQRVARYAERQMIYEAVSAQPGVVWAHSDVARVTGIDRRVVTDQVNSMRARYAADYPHLSVPARGTVRYDGPATAPAPAVPAPVRPAPVEAAPVPPAPVEAAPDAMIVTVARRSGAAMLVIDEDTGRTYVMRPATAADLAGP